ncbi:MAG TPA: 2-dehydropantoate 2-reductase [Anaerolineae bacterium]
MKILIYGAGAVGGYLGAKLAQSGHDVTMIARTATAEVASANGLYVTENGQTQLVRPQVVSSVAQAFMGDDVSYELIIMGMKSYDVRPALDPLIAFCPSPPAIITTQNGIGVEQPLINQFGAERIVAGSVTIPISKETANKIVVERSDRGLALAPVQPGRNIKEWVNLFKKAGIETERVKRYESMKWSKALLNIVGNATSAILNRRPSLIYKSDAIFDLEMQMLREALAVMDKLGLDLVDLPGMPTNRLAFGVRRLPKPLLKPILIRAVSEGRGDKMPSFHIDLTSGKGKSEVIYHNGAIAKVGQEHHVPVPVNTALTDILWKLTRDQLDWREYDGRPGRLVADVKRYQRAAARSA